MITAPYPQKIASVMPKLSPPVNTQPVNTGKDKWQLEEERRIKENSFIKLPEGEDYESKKKKRAEEDAKKDAYGATPHGDWRFNPIPSDRPWLNIFQGAANMMQGTQRAIKGTPQKEIQTTSQKEVQDQNIRQSQYGGSFEPHMMIHPSSNKSIYALTEADHNEYANKGYVHQDRYKWGGFKSNLSKYIRELPKAQFGEKDALGKTPTAGAFDYLNSNAFNQMNQQNAPVTPAPVWNSVQAAPVAKTYSQSGSSFKDPMAVNDNYVEPEEIPVDPFKPKPEEEDIVIPGSERQQGEPNPLAVTPSAQPDSELKRQLDEEDAYVKQRAEKDAEAKAKKEAYMSPADQILVGFNTFNTGLEARKEKRNRPELLSKARTYGNTVNDSDYYASNDAIFGQKTVNRGLGTDIFNSQHQYANYGKFGGLSKFINGGGFNYKDGDEVIMSKEELDRYIQMGGQVEILDDLTKPKY